MKLPGTGRRRSSAASRGGDGSFHPNEVSRRAHHGSIAVVAVFVVLLGGFFRAQILNHGKFATQSDANRLREIPVPSQRAVISDRSGGVIADNVVGYSVSLIATNADSLRAALARLGDVIPLSAELVDRAMRRFKSAPSRPVLVVSDASFDMTSVLEEHRAALPGLIVQSAPRRYYPEGSVVGALVGYLSEITDPDVARKRGAQAGQLTGMTGLERQYDERLRGGEGARYVEVDARGRVIRDAGSAMAIAPTIPAPLVTNIDLDLQRYMAKAFGDSLQGGAVALDPVTGAVLALYSAPSYDPNKFVGGVSTEYWRALNDDARHPLYNKVLAGRYPPGSTFKLATAAIAMEDSLVTLDQHMVQPCTGGYVFGGRYFRCHDPKGHGDISLSRAIEVSCDVYFYQLGLKLGISRLIAGGVALGFGKRSGIDLPDESAPFFPTAVSYFNKRYGPRGWTNAVSLNMAIGQGENAQTVISMARFYTALATDGEEATPQIVRAAPVRRPLFHLTSEQLAGLRQAMRGVVEHGTATTAAIADVDLAGKTGTAQNGYGPDKTHAWFVGFAPAQQPKIVIALMLEFGGEGPRAARVASKIVAHYLGETAVPVTALAR